MDGWFIIFTQWWQELLFSQIANISFLKLRRHYRNKLRIFSRDFRLDKAGDRTIRWLGVRWKYHSTESVAAKRSILLPELLTIFKLVDTFSSNTMCQSLPNELHPLDSNLIFPHELLVSYIKSVGRRIIPEARLLLRFGHFSWVNFKSRESHAARRISTVPVYSV